MSVWSRITGTIEIRKSDNISLKKKIKELCDESSIDIETVDKIDHYIHTIDASVCLDGWELQESFPKWLKSIPSKYADLTLEARYLI